MSIDRNGRSHKPKGLPQHEAGTYERAHTAMRDDDLQADPTPTPERNWLLEPVSYTHLTLPTIA